MIYRNPDLRLNDRIALACQCLLAKAVADWGAISQYALVYQTSRQTVYDVMQQAEQALIQALAPAAREAGVVTVDTNRIQRAIVTLRMETKASVRGIQAALEEMYDVSVSVGYIENALQDAYARARQFNEQARLDGVQDVALDELFVGRQPVLGGVELESSLVFALERTDQRDGESWAITLWDAEKQGAQFRVVVSDAGDGIGAGIKLSELKATHRGDNFHAIRIINEMQWHLERRAYKVLNQEQEQEKKWRKNHEADQTYKLAQKLRFARERSVVAMALADQYEFWAEMARDALWFVALEAGRWRSGSACLAQLNSAVTELKKLDCEKVAPVTRYLENQGTKLVQYVDTVVGELEKLNPAIGSELVSELARLWRIEKEWEKSRLRWQRRKELEQLWLDTSIRIERVRPADWEQIKARVFAVIEKSLKRSSALAETINSILRPFLFVQRGVSQGFLELFVAWHNLRTYPRGRRRGQSPWQMLTGKRYDDWLQALGYAPKGEAATG